MQLSNTDDDHYMITTIFQDKMPPGKSIHMNGENHTDKLHFARKGDGGAVELIDTNGNAYNVKGGKYKFVAQIKKQTSRSQTGEKETHGKYASAYLMHSLPTMNDYEYAIVIAGGDKRLLTKYHVIEKNRFVHAVKFSKSSNTETYGYAVFDNFQSDPLTVGPVHSVTRPCMIMLEKNATVVNLAISNPDLNFGTDDSMVSKPTCTSSINETLAPRSSEEAKSRLMFCVESKAIEMPPVALILNFAFKTILKVTSNGQDLDPNGFVVDHHNRTRPFLDFGDLRNGFSKELQLSIND